MKITWRKSSHSGGNTGECVELAALPHAIAIRDSKNPTGPILTVTRADLATLFTAIKADSSM
jgi:Domain of unknown function (DUF397)